MSLGPDMDNMSQFLAAIESFGMVPPKSVTPGKVQRFAGVGKGLGNTAGWCIFFNDGQGGKFGDFSTGMEQEWRPTCDHSISRDEQQSNMRRSEEVKEQADEVRRVEQAKAAVKASTIWNSAAPALDDHPYLARKGIQAYGTKIHNEALVIPIACCGDLKSLQFIRPDGEKRFLKGGRISGCYYLIGYTDMAETLCVAEGFATGATIHSATGYPVAVAFTAGNLRLVAEEMRKQFPSIKIIVCGDNDSKTIGNPGLTKAKEAANAVRGLISIPDFQSGGPVGTDFNDLAAATGLDSVRQAIKNASVPIEDEHSSQSLKSDHWEEPQPLVAKVEMEPYPLTALPGKIRAAIEEVQAFTKAPLPLVASSALAALSLAIQAQVDVARAERLSGPTSLFLLTIADSGERKSTCDGFFSKAIRNYEQEQYKQSINDLKDFKAALEAWESKRSGIKEKIRQLAKENKPSWQLEEALRNLEHDEPKPPLVPRLMYTDATPEALAYALATKWPSGGVVSSEGGIVFGAHGMGKDSVMRNLGLLNILWDGGNLTIDRRSVDSFTVKNSRLTVAIQVQDATARNFFERTDGLARGTGFFARFLLAWPESTQGFRPFTDSPEIWHALEAFNQRLSEILGQPIPTDENGTLTPTLMSFRADAKAAWIAFHDAIEHELVSGGELHDVRDVASKIADNAARIACLFEVFEGFGGAISLESFEAASRIAAWHLNESRRFFGELALPSELTDVARLDSWIISYCKNRNVNYILQREIQRNVNPIHLRKKAALEPVLLGLIETGRIRVMQQGRNKVVMVNPALLGGDAA